MMIKDGYLYETHLHTAQASACGIANGEDYIDHMMSLGYQGMFVTDHFFNGNSCVPALPWKERVKWYASGYDRAFAAAEGKDFDVFFGIEFNFKGDEYLLYGVGVDWLLKNEDLLGLSRQEVYSRVHEGGGIMVHAHPYRERGYLSDIWLTPEVTDGAEVYNAANPDYQNALGYVYAEGLDVPMTAGSDIHRLHHDAMGGMLFKRRIKDERDFARAILGREGVPVRVFEGRIEPVKGIRELTETEEKPTLPVHRLDREGKPLPEM